MKKLFLWENNLTNLDLDNNKSLLILSIISNPNLKVNFLPSTLMILAADKQAILDYNFEHLTQLKQLTVYGPKEEPIRWRDFTKLRKGVKLYYNDRSNRIRYDGEDAD